MAVMAPCIAVLVRDFQRDILALPVEARPKGLRTKRQRVAQLRGVKDGLEVAVGGTTATIRASGDWRGSMIVDARDLYRIAKSLPFGEAAMLRPFQGMLEISVGRYRAEIPSLPDYLRHTSTATLHRIADLDVTSLPLFATRPHQQ